jgi:hypothetical protein
MVDQSIQNRDMIYGLLSILPISSKTTTPKETPQHENNMRFAGDEAI